MKEYLSRKYNNIYNAIIILILLAFFLFILSIFIVYLDEIIAGNKIDVLLFYLILLLLFLFFIRLNYYINEIIVDYENKTIIVKKIFSKKVFSFSSVNNINNIIIPYYNFIVINDKKYFFISRSIDPLGDNFTLNQDEDLKSLKEIMKNFKRN